MKSHSQSRPNVFTAADTITTIQDNIKRRVENTTEGLSSECCRLLHNRVLPANTENAMVICDYVTSLRSEINPSDGHRENIVILLSKFSIFFNGRPFRAIAREDVISFLDSFRKIETINPLHKWIGTYNLYKGYLLRFFKWLYYPNIEPDKRPKPGVVQNIPQLKRKEKSIYKPTDIWTPEETLYF